MGPGIWDPVIWDMGMRDPALGTQESGTQHLGPIIWDLRVRDPARHMGPFNSGPGTQGPVKSLCSLVTLNLTVFLLLTVLGLTVLAHYCFYS